MTQWLRSLTIIGVLGVAAAVVPAQQEAETLIRGGEVVTADGRRLADVRIVGATIAEVGTGLVFMVLPSFDQHVRGFIATMQAARSAGVLVMMHCEDAAIIQTTAERMMAEGRASIEHFADARPVAAEVAATQRAVAMAEATGAPTYIVHLSSERALRVAEDAQRRGLPVFGPRSGTGPIRQRVIRIREEGPIGVDLTLTEGSHDIGLLSRGSQVRVLPGVPSASKKTT